jgi:hypothetical protein
VPPIATAGATGYCALQGVSFWTLHYNSMRAPHLIHLETQTKDSYMHVSRQVLKPGTHKEADEREFLTGHTTGRP